MICRRGRQGIINHAAAIAPAILALDPAEPFGPHRKDAGEGVAVMEGKARLIFPILATAIVVFVASAAVTFMNIGLRIDFVRRWLSAFSVGWPVAAVTAYLAFPIVRRATSGIVALIERR